MKKGKFLKDFTDEIIMFDSLNVPRKKTAEAGSMRNSQSALNKSGKLKSLRENIANGPR